MQRIDGELVFSPTDLVGSLACAHLADLELAALAGLVKRPVRDDEALDLIRQRGAEHEVRHLEGLEREGRRVTRIVVDGRLERGVRFRKAAEDAEAAIRRGDD